MSEKTICTIEELKQYLKDNLSEKRYIHVLAVAETTEKVLQRYNCSNYERTWNGFSAGTFCGLAHDICREMEDNQWIGICNANHVEYAEDELARPVLLHGYVSAIKIKEMFPQVPQSWTRAIEMHTLGGKDMDDLALALYIADYLEPNRTYLTNEQRKVYLDCPTIQECAYAILCSINNHLLSKGVTIGRNSMLMKEFLEGK